MRESTVISTIPTVRLYGAYPTVQALDRPARLEWAGGQLEACRLCENLILNMYIYAQDIPTGTL
jgi:hypothetical protein